MPRFEPVWLEIAEKQYASLPPDQRRLVDAKVEQLLENPTADPAASYNRKSDQWSVPFGDGRRLIFYAVVYTHGKVIFLRIIAIS